MKSLTVHIPQPCPERWDAMQPNGQGRFCANCRKTVVDYTALSDRELARVLSRSSDDICGRLGADQLNRPLVIPDPVTTHWQRWLGVLTMGLLSWQTAQAQVKQAEPRAASVAKDWLIKPLAIREQATPAATWTVSGRVMLEDSSGTSPLAQADVYVRAGAGWLAKTDDTGAFSLSIPAQSDSIQLRIGIAGPDHQRGGVIVTVSPQKPSVNAGDIIVYGAQPQRTISGGGLAIVRQPTRWEQIKGKLFRRDR